MITTAHQDMLASWLCKRIGYVPSQAIKCIGNVVDNQIIGVVGYDGFNGASVMMHAAGTGNWCTRSMLFATFDYPFKRLGCQVVLGLVPSGNLDALVFNQRLGFKIAHELPGAHPDGSLFLMTMRPEDCRFTETRFGREVRAPA